MGHDLWFSSPGYRFGMASSTTVEPQIIDVWQDNLDEAFEDIMDLIPDHTLIGMV